MSHNEKDIDIIDEGSSEIEVIPTLYTSRDELNYCYKRHKIFSLIHKREGIMCSSPELSAAEDISPESDGLEILAQKTKMRRSLRNKNTVAKIEYNEKSDCEDFSASTDSYAPSSESDTDKENDSRNNDKIKKDTKKTHNRSGFAEEDLKFKTINKKWHSEENKHMQSLTLDSSVLQEIDVNKSVISYNSDIFNNVSHYENVVTENFSSSEGCSKSKNRKSNNQDQNNKEHFDTTLCLEQNNQKNRNPIDDVIVAKSSNDGAIRKWDKKQACLFCLKLVAKLPRHLEAVHSKESEVIKMLSFSKKSEQRKILLDDLRKKGNYFHNSNVLKAGSGIIIPQKRSKSETSVDSLLPCPSCLAFYSRKKLSRHYSSCSKREDKKAKSVQREGSMLLPISEAASEKLRNNVLARMNTDAISLLVRQDDLILKLGSTLMTKHDQDPHLNGYISQKMRELARFLHEIRKIYPAIQNLSECINPIFFPKVIDAVRTVSTYNSVTGKYGTPSLALKIGHSLKKCANIIITESLIHNLPLKREMAQNFIRLCENEWSTNISTGALTTIYRNKWNMPDRLPLAEDVKLLNNFLCDERDKYMILLKNAEVTIHNWTSLAKIVLAQTLLFNRRRAGEVEKIPVETYLNKLNSKDIDKSIHETLSEFEKAISQTFVRFEVRGKKGRKVPIILYPKLIEAYDILMLYRFHVGIPKENIYFFASPPLSHFRGSDVMRTFAVSSGAKQPQNLTSTKLRKNVATMSQILNLSNHELDQLAKFMGHDIRVHREYYRLPESTIQLAKISKILIASEKGKLQKYKGKNLDEIDININKISDDDESDTEDDLETNLLELPPQQLQDDTAKMSNDLEPNEEQTTLLKKKSRYKKSTDVKLKKKTWTGDEKRVVEEYFTRAIIRQKVPGKDDCVDCLEKNAHILEDRDWKAIKYYVYNIIQKKKKKKV